jgi:4-hydroxy-3-polyprenylbenzoate decarboxylase
MAFRDLRDWIDHLRREGELHEVTAEVDPHLEISEITDRVTKAGGPALLFTNVRGSSMPLLINQFGTERRMWRSASTIWTSWERGCRACSR